MHIIIGLEDFQVFHLGSDKYRQDIINMIKSYPLKRFVGTTGVFKDLDNAGCQLNSETLGIIEDCDYATALCLKNFSASEIQIYTISMKQLRIFLEQSHKNNKLKLVFTSIRIPQTSRIFYNFHDIQNRN